MSTVTRIDKSHERLDITVDAKTVDKAIEKAKAVVSKLSERPLSEKQLGKDPAQTKKSAVLSRATRSVAEEAVRDAIQTHGLRPSKNPTTSIDEFVTPGKPFSFSIVIDVVPELDLKYFDKLVVNYDADTEVTDEDVDNRLEEIRGRSAEVEKDSDKPISENDIVEVSFDSFIDDEPYEGSSVDGYAYTVGSHEMPDEFEAALVGMHANEGKTVEFKIPEDFDNEEIAGKTARFDIKVNRVASCTLPEVDDAFAQEFGYEDLAFWRNKIKNELQNEKEGNLEEIKEKAAREALADELEDEPGDDVITATAHRMLAAFKTDLQQQGTNFDEYCRYLHLAEEDVFNEMKEEATTITRENLALESLFRRCNFKINHRELRKTIGELLEENGMPKSISFEQFNQDQQTAIREMTMHRMATEWLMEHADFVAQ